MADIERLPNLLVVNALGRAMAPGTDASGEKTATQFTLPDADARPSH
jgi:hypothetical protein